MLLPSDTQPASVHTVPPGSVTTGAQAPSQLGSIGSPPPSGGSTPPAAAAPTAITLTRENARSFRNRWVDISLFLSEGLPFWGNRDSPGEGNPPPPRESSLASRRRFERGRDARAAAADPRGRCSARSRAR